jgi:ATP-binding cassette subfamily F protein uup
VFEGEGRVVEYIGGYEDWVRQRAKDRAVKTVEPEAEKPRGKSERARKFLNREQRELDEMPALLEKLEAEHVVISAKLADPATYQDEPAMVPKLKAELSDVEARTQQAFARWEELEAIRKACEL